MPGLFERSKVNGKSKKLALKMTHERKEFIIDELRSLQKQRVAALRSKIMIGNRLRSLVAMELGYVTSDSKEQREEHMKEADSVIKKVKEDPNYEFVARALISTTLLSQDGFDDMAKMYEKKMKNLAKELPIARWAEAKEQRGFGILSLAKIIGETGDLDNYPCVTALYKRMGCLPWSYDKGNGEILTKMGCTWSKEGGLPASEWVEFGYSPRRRSEMYVIGTCLMKAQSEKDEEGNITWTGPYRKRYDESRARYEELHPDYKFLGARANFHGQLCMVKLLLRELYNAWKGLPWGGGEYGYGGAKQHPNTRARS